jgi:hypothetical protein
MRLMQKKVSRSLATDHSAAMNGWRSLLLNIFRRVSRQWQLTILRSSCLEREFISKNK